MDWSSPLWYASYILVLLGLAGYGSHRLLIVFLYIKHARNHPKAKELFKDLPLVTIQLPVFNEMHVVDRLLNSVAALDYPQDKMQIQLLDDSTDETVDICRAGIERLKTRGFDAEHIHRVDRTGFKAGALENGTKSAKGEYLLILDADFVPNPDLLQKTIHYFTDNNIGMIQTRWGHLNRAYNVLTRIQAMFLDGHLELEQTARMRVIALNDATRGEERQAKKEGRPISPENIERLVERFFARLPYKSISSTYHSFVVYVSTLQRLGWIEFTGREEPSAFQDNYPDGNSRRYFRLTQKGREAPDSAWANPHKYLYGSK